MTRQPDWEEVKARMERNGNGSKGAGLFTQYYHMYIINMIPVLNFQISRLTTGISQQLWYRFVWCEWS